MIEKSTIKLHEDTARRVDVERARIAAETGLPKVSFAAAVEAVLRRALPPAPAEGRKNG